MHSVNLRQARNGSNFAHVSPILKRTDLDAGRHPLAQQSPLPLNPLKVCQPISRDHLHGRAVAALVAVKLHD